MRARPRAYERFNSRVTFRLQGGAIENRPPVYGDRGGTRSIRRANGKGISPLHILKGGLKVFFAASLSDTGIAEIYRDHSPEEDSPETEAATARILSFMEELQGRPDYPEIEDTIFNYAAIYERHGFIAGFKAAIKVSRWISEQPEGAELEDSCKRALLRYEAEQKAAKA